MARIGIAFICILSAIAAYCLVVLPLALGYWYICTGHKTFTIPDVYLVYAFVSLALTVVLPICFWCGFRGDR